MALEQLRNTLRSKVTWVLLGLVALALAFTGNDFFGGGGGQSHVATVDGKRISFGETAEAWDRLSRNLPPSELRNLEAQNQRRSELVSSLVRDQRMRLEAERLGVRVTDNALAEQIRSTESLRVQTSGLFDRAAYDSSFEDDRAQQDYEERVRDAMAAELLQRGVIAGLAGAPNTVTSMRLRYLMEERVVSAVIIAPTAIPDPGAAPLEELQAVYDASREDLASPQLRTVSVALFIPDAEAGRDQIPAAQLAARAEQIEAAGAVEPERRSVIEVIAPDEETALRVAAALRDGEEPAAIAASEEGVTLREYTDVELDAITDPVVQTAAFALEEPGVSDPVENTLESWSVAQVVAITPELAMTAERALELATESMARDVALRIAQANAEAFQTARDANPNFDEAVRASGAEVRVFESFNADGLGLDGEPVWGDLDEVTGRAIVERAFTRDVRLAGRSASDTVQQTAAATSFALRFDAVTEPQPREFDEVIEEVTSLWRAQRIAETQEQAAELAVTALEAGASLNEAALATGVDADADSFVFSRAQSIRPAADRGDIAVEGEVDEPPTLAQLRRVADAGGLPPELLSLDPPEKLGWRGAVAAFAAPAGAVLRVQGLEGAELVLRIEAVLPAPPGFERAYLPQRVRGTVYNSIAGDVLRLHAVALGERYPVTVNDEMLLRATGGAVAP